MAWRLATALALLFTLGATIHGAHVSTANAQETTGSVHLFYSPG